MEPPARQRWRFSVRELALLIAYTALLLALGPDFGEAAVFSASCTALAVLTPIVLARRAAQLVQADLDRCAAAGRRTDLYFGTLAAIAMAVAAVPVSYVALQWALEHWAAASQWLLRWIGIG